eukprot:5548667-Pyramimonas_sp.AAC.1
MSSNVLCDLGAAGPFFGISGFSTQTKFKPFDTFAKEMDMNLELVFWGSPHWGTERDDTTRHFKDSATFKTNAWQSMSWLAGSACIMMTFPSYYKVEFWGPTY